MKLSLPKHLELGVAAASMQVEGGELDSNWHDWYKQGRIKDNSNPAVANDHWNRYEEDFKIMETMGVKHYRFSIEWTRIEPVEGEFDESALEHYRDMILSMKKHGIKPLMTLWHFSHPMWFENKGGFLERDNVHYFTRYVDKVVSSLGDLIDEYVTINEPNVFAVEGYLFNEWPPSNKNGFGPVLKVMSVLAACHIFAYHIIKEHNPEALVSFAHHVRSFKGKTKKDEFIATVMSRLFQTNISHAFMKGDFKLPLINYFGFKKGHYCDVISVNYYSTTVVSGMEFGFSEDMPKNDLNWDIYPEGLIRNIRELYAIHPVPIYVTESGTCDNDDRFRSRYIYEHLEVLTKSGLPILRNYYWSYSDNFEWIEGNTSRFGLVHINYETQERTIKDSGWFYKGIIENSGVTLDAYNEYVAEVEYDNR